MFPLYGRCLELFECVIWHISEKINTQQRTISMGMETCTGVVDVTYVYNMGKATKDVQAIKAIAWERANTQKDD